MSTVNEPDLPYMAETANLKLPYLAAAQSQKHVTHNEALRAIDAVVQLGVLDRDLSAPPASPAEGDRYIVAGSPTGAWNGQAGRIAAWQDGAWMFYAANKGWLAWVVDEGRLYAFDGLAWSAYPSASGGTSLSVGTRTANSLDVESDTGAHATLPQATTTLAGLMGSADKTKLDGVEAGATADMTGAEIATALAGQSPQSIALLGINATADATNKLSLSSAASLFNHAGNGHQVKVNKAVSADTASFLFQTGFSGRAEMGTTGDDDFRFKVSANGTTWTEAIVINRATGAVTFPNTTIGGGEANTAGNVNTAGVGVFKQKTGVNLEFRGINAGSSKISVTSDAANNEIDIDVTESNLTLANLGGSIDLGGAKASGTIAAARMPAHTGDVTSPAGSVALTIGNQAVTYAKMQNVSASSRLMGRISAGAGSPEEVTGTQATAMLDTFTTSLKGLAPASGGGTTNFLRADGTWAAPSGGGWTLVKKTSDETRTNTATVAADSTLRFSMAANTRYALRARIFLDTGATEDFKWRHAGPVAASLVRIRRMHILPAATALASIGVDQAYSTADITMPGTGTNGGWIDFDGIVANGSNTGDFNFHWAQNTAGAANTTVLAGSYLEYTAV